MMVLINSHKDINIIVFDSQSFDLSKDSFASRKK